ncbi:unnamed protein product, partial [Staurois parvus]
CPIVGVSEGRNSAHRWCQWGRNSAPSLVSVRGGILSHRWCQWGGGIVPHRWCQ